MASNLTKVNPRLFTDSMEQLQQGYVAAIAASCGVSVQGVDRDMYGHDVEFMRQPDITVEEVSVRAQLKSTTGITIKPGATEFSYTFKSRAAFEALAMPRTMQKRFLIVMAVPQNQNRWTYAHSRGMLLRHSCYWVSLEHQTATVEQPTIKVPLKNLFDAAALTTIMDKIEQGLPL